MTYTTRKRRMPTPLSKRVALAAAALAIVAAACGGGGDDTAANDTAANDTAANDTAESTPNADAPTAQAPATPAPSGDVAPAQEFTLFDGTPATLADFRGTPLVVNFWASWCPSCVAEMSAAFRPVQESLGDQVAFVGMNIQDERELANRLLAETGVEWISAEDPNGELYIEFGGLGMPFTVYIDAEGSVIHEHNGPLDERLLRDQIAENLGVAS